MPRDISDAQFGSRKESSLSMASAVPDASAPGLGFPIC